MEYRRLGGSGLQVSAIGLGTNTFGTDVDLPKADAVIGAFIDAGCNFIDSADSYPPGGKQGDSEVIIGQALKNGRREKVLVATKFYSRVGNLPNDVGGSLLAPNTPGQLRAMRALSWAILHLTPLNANA